MTNGQFPFPLPQGFPQGFPPGLPSPQALPVPPFATAEGIRNMTIPLESVKSGIEQSVNSLNAAMMSMVKAFQAPLTHQSPQPIVAPLDAFIRTVKTSGLPLPMPDSERAALQIRAQNEGISVPTGPGPGMSGIQSVQPQFGGRTGTPGVPGSEQKSPVESQFGFGFGEVFE